MNLVLSRPLVARVLAVVLTVLLVVVGVSLPALADDTAPDPAAADPSAADPAAPTEPLPSEEAPAAPESTEPAPEATDPASAPAEPTADPTGPSAPEEPSDPAEGTGLRVSMSTLALTTSGITVSPSSLLDGGDAVTITGSLPAEIVQDAGAGSGTPATTGIYLMYCVQGATAPGTAAGRLTGSACHGAAQQYLVASPGPLGGTVAGSVTDGVWEFTATMSVPAGFGTHTCAHAADDGEQCGVFVRLYHGFSAANLANPYAYDQFVPVTFAPAAGITVSPTTGLADGDTVSVRGSFPAEIVRDTGASSGTAATTGVYLMYCAEGTAAPGTAAGRLGSGSCSGAVQQYLVATAGPAGGTVAGVVDDGWWTFESEMALPAAFGTHACAQAAVDGEQCGVFVRLYHGFSAGNLADPYVYDQFVPVTFAAPGTTDPGTGPGGPTGPADPGAPASVALSVSPSTLNPAVANTVTVSGSGYTGPGAANGVYVSLGLAGQWRPGQVPSSAGWLRAVHVPASQLSGGSFRTTISLPVGTLTLGQSYGVATFAAHELAVTNRTLDAWAPITLSTTAASAATRTTTPADTPPSEQGVETGSEDFVEGGSYTFTATGYQPNETGILAVIYSEPTVLADDLAADAAGAVTWTGALPRGLTGAHTFTFQGSVDRGIVIDIAAAPVVGCAVDGAELDWGFKESFRAYIDGSIANGGWTTAGGATYATPVFSWTNGSGGYDASTGDADLAFTGSVRFTGHAGALDTTIADPRIVIDGDRAVLLLDIHGTTQEGEPVSSTGVEFAELDLEAAERGGGGDLVAVTGIPASLTAAGAAAFGTYPEGETLDAVDLRITADPACLQTVAAQGETRDADPVAATSALPWVLGGLGVLALAAVPVVVLVRRRRAA